MSLPVRVDEHSGYKANGRPRQFGLVDVISIQSPQWRVSGKRPKLEHAWYVADERKTTWVKIKNPNYSHRPREGRNCSSAK